ncbi:MAG: DnaJ C-terminal domain-containing protein [Chitinophagaceae bacterium]
MDYIDYYKVLDLERNATDEEIKKAYRKLARKFHPDLNPNDKDAEKRFKEINEANEVLGNAENRKKYDQYGKDWKHAEEIEKQRQQYSRQGNSGASQGFSGSGFEGFSQGGFGGEDGDYSDFFESLFGSRESGSRQQRFRGQDLQASMSLSLRDVFHTHKRELDVNGRKIRITIPAGMEDGQKIRLKGHGGPGANGGPAGDLYIEFHIQNDTPFRRQGNELYSTVPLDLYTAILGGEVLVDTFDGKVKLKSGTGHSKWQQAPVEG